MNLSEWILHLFQIGLSFYITYLVVRLHRHHKQFLQIVDEANDLLNQMHRHDTKLSILISIYERKAKEHYCEEKSDKQFEEKR